MAIIPPFTLPEYALVTGAKGGIGAAICRKFIENGVTVIALDAVECENGDYGDMMICYQCDLGEPAQISNVWQDLARQEIVVDCLVNNAGILKLLSIEEYDQAQITEVLNVNLVATFHMTRHFSRQAVNGGSIVNVSSIAAFAGGSDPIYSASKAGLIGLTKSLAIALAPRIRVNAVAPSVVPTPMVAKLPKETIDKYKQKELLKNELSPASVADLVFFLSSSEARNITGSTLDINNGAYLR